jgi:hypothetical protein
MADGSQNSESSPSEQRLPIKAQIRAAAYGGRQQPAPIVDVPAETEAEPLPLAVPSNPASADTWLIAATKADGWDIWLCDQVLRGHEIESEVVASGIPSVRVRRKDYSAAIRKLQEEKSRLWQKPTGMANVIVSLVFVGMIAFLTCGGVIASGRFSQTGGIGAGEMLFIAILLPVVVLVVFGFITALRRR